MAKAAAKKEPPKSLLEIHRCAQGSSEWFEARRGLITASNFGVVLRDAEAKTRTKLLHRIAGEQLSGEIDADTFKSESMNRGNIWEQRARDAYCKHRGVEVDQVGLITNFSGLKRCGASPDGLVGFDCGLEIKINSPVVLAPMLEKGAVLPSAARAQVHGNIWVAERDMWDFVSFWPGMPRYIVRVYRDEAVIKEISDGVERFNYDVKQLVEHWKKQGRWEE